MQFMHREAKQFVAHKREEQKQRIRERINARAAVNRDSLTVRIFQWMERMAEKVSQNEKWQTVAKSFSVPPKEFAYAVGEGLVMYKITSPLWMSVELLLIVKYLQWRRQGQEVNNT